MKRIIIIILYCFMLIVLKNNYLGMDKFIKLTLTFGWMIMGSLGIALYRSSLMNKKLL